MSLDITINQLGEGARELAFTNQLKQGKKINGEARLMDKEESFDFAKSNEGPDFWGHIIEGDFFTALDIYEGPHKLMIVDASNNHATYYLKGETLHYDFSGMKVGDTTEVMKALEMKDKLMDERAMPIYGTKRRGEMSEKAIKAIERFKKLWNKRKK